MISEEQLKQLEIFQPDPELFFREVLGIDTLEFYQTSIVKVIADNDRIAISASHDVGKSWTLARIVLWYVTCFPYCKVITTAPTFNQVKNILWSEIRAGYARSKFPLGGKLNQTDWQVTQEGDWFAIGFSPQNELSGEAGQGAQSSFQGFHAPHLMIVFDEATGIRHSIWTMAEGMLTSGNTKFVAIGNPTSRNSEFYKCFSSPEWTKIKLSCFDSPNLKANGITNIEELTKEIDLVKSMSDLDAQERLKSYKVERDYLITLKWVVSMGLPRKWGISHPLFVSKVLGQFPKDSDDVLIPLGVVEDAQFRVAYPSNVDRKSLGVDIARFGSDATVFTGIHGNKFLLHKKANKKDTTEVTGEIIALCNNEEKPFDIIVIDETGIGGGVVDLCREAQRENRIPRTTEIRGVQFGAACDESEKEKFVNVKARMFRLLADDLKTKDGLCLPQGDDVYLDELPTILFGYDSKGRMFVESKDDYRKRTGRKSPDDADSLALANYGRYDEITVGKFAENKHLGFARPFAASLGSGRQW